MSTSTRREALWVAGLLAVSIGVHAVAVQGLGRGARATRPHPRPPALVMMEVAAPKPPPPSPPPAPAPAAPRAPKAAAPRVAATRPVTVAPAAPPPPPAQPVAETPADFTGTTLTNDGPGPGWASATGNGQAMNGPVGTPGAKVTGRSQAGAAAGGDGPAAAPSGPPLLKLADLSQPPHAPELDDVLERNYPEDARKHGLQGQAVLRVRVMPDGRVRDLIVMAESGGGFGEACKRTLRASVWSPPLDRDAHPVSTFVSYTCRFEVR